MNVFKKPITIFFVFNLLISFPLYFLYSKSLGIESFISVSYFTFIWVLIFFLVNRAVSNYEVDIVSASFAIQIGLKFLLSMFFIGVMIWTNTFVDLPGILLFLVYYFVYTFIMLLQKEE